MMTVRVFAIALILFSQIAHAQSSSFQQVITRYGATHGGELAGAPKIKPDGALYYLHGKIQQAGQDPAFLANLAPSEENELLANALRRSRGMSESTEYFAVTIPKTLQKYYFDSAKLGGGFDLIGRYVSNTKYKTVSGREMQAPVFEAVYLDLWAKRLPSSTTPQAKTAAPQTATPANTYERCINDAAGIMPSMIDCAANEAKRQDVRLNAAYKIAIGKVTDKDGLKNRQRAWIKERDKACEIDNDGGQLAVLNSHECIAKETARRASELEAER